MSTLKVEVLKIDGILLHDNADRLEIALLKGWQCVIPKGKFQVGDKVIYLPVDSVLPSNMEEIMFPPGSKIKLNKSRIKTIKIRGVISQGMVEDPRIFGLENIAIGKDVKEKLGISKYEPPERSSAHFNMGKSTKKQVNPNFKKYTDIENFKNYVKVFKEGDQVVATEKIHGSNFRAGYVKRAGKWWEKLMCFLSILDPYEFVYGSHNVQLQNKIDLKTFYNKNVYAEMVIKYDLKNKITNGFVIIGEIYGSGIQKNYLYGCAEGEHKLILFDVIKEGKYLDCNIAKDIAKLWKLDMVPELYKGPFSLEKIQKLVSGKSILCPKQKIREGIVLKSEKEEVCHIGRKILKLINSDYLVNKNTEFH